MEIDRQLMTPTSGRYMDRLVTKSSRGPQQCKNPSAQMAGCTANVVLITRTRIYCANAGDSRCIIRDSNQVIPLSTDHKPDNEIESARIQAAGHMIIRDRVDAELAVSRALGDWDYKDPG